MRSSLDHKPMGGPFGTGRVQFSSVASSVSGREVLRKSGDSGPLNSTTGTGNNNADKGGERGGVGNKSYSRGLAPLTSPQKTEEPSKLLQSERARYESEHIFRA